MKKERRRKIVYVPHRFIMDFLTFAERDCIRRPVIDLPEGFEIITCRYSVERDAFGFLIYHDSFDIVPRGIMCPEMVLGMIEFVKVKSYETK